MILAVRCPTGATPQLAKAWESAMNVAEGVRIKDEETETEVCVPLYSYTPFGPK